MLNYGVKVSADALLLIFWSTLIGCFLVHSFANTWCPKMVVYYIQNKKGIAYKCKKTRYCIQKSYCCTRSCDHYTKTTIEALQMWQIKDKQYLQTGRLCNGSLTFIECLSIWGYFQKDEDNTPRIWYILDSYANLKLFKSWGTWLCSGCALERELNLCFMWFLQMRRGLNLILNSDAICIFLLQYETLTKWGILLSLKK